MKFSTAASAGLILIGFVSMMTLGCVTRHGPVTEFHQALREETSLAPGRRTIVVFLIDGLPLMTLREMTSKGDLPHIRKYLMGSKNKIYTGNSVFPTLTYPNISSLLTTSGVDRHLVIGNRILSEGKELSFESPNETVRLNGMLGQNTVFSRLDKEHRSSVSLAHSFWCGSTSHITADIEAGLAYANTDYEYIDFKIIDSLKNVLAGTRVSLWPEFIFVHLVGVDFTSHDEGPDSTAVRDYLKKIDERLEDSFELLERAEKKRTVVSLLTSDHGFDKKIDGYINLEEFIHNQDKEITLLNEGRFGALYFPKEWKSRRQSEMLHRMVRDNKGIAMIAYREKDSVIIESKLMKTRLDYKPGHCLKTDFQLSFRQDMKGGPSSFVCPENMPAVETNSAYPFLVPNLAIYFDASTHPDAVVFAESGVSFTHDLKGQHGGATAGEVLVPVLMRNATPRDSREVISLDDLLKFI